MLGGRPLRCVDERAAYFIPNQAIRVGGKAAALVGIGSLAQADAADLKNVVIGVDTQLTGAVNLVFDNLPNKTCLLYTSDAADE